MAARRGLLSVAEDIEWLQHCWAYEPDRLTDADVRRGGATLRRLLLERGQGAIMAAWRMCGLAGQPRVIGPDLLALLEQEGHTLERTVSAVAGGVPISGVIFVATGAHRVDHPDGTSADAEQGFAVAVGSIAARLPNGDEVVPKTIYDDNIHREWRLRDYIEAPGGVRLGKPIARRDIIQYFCKDAGSVHVDELFGSAKARSDGERLAAELDKRVFTDWRNGLTLEVLAIGHSLGRSEDLAKLVAAIRDLPDDGDEPPASTMPRP